MARMQQQIHIREADTRAHFWLVVMGVSGCGKSSLGAALAASLGLPLIEGDDFHPEAKAKLVAK